MKDLLKSNSEKFDYLFVYGTLMKGRRNRCYLNDESYVGDSVLEDYGLLELGHFPGAVPKKGSKVYGEIYRVSERERRDIDYLEGNLYVYKENIFTVNGKTYKAGFYVYYDVCNERGFMWRELTEEWRNI